MTRRIYGYLRASTIEQDATRAKASLEQFAHDRGEIIAGWFIENASGATIDRPELFKLINIAMPGDIILIEQIDRISRLDMQDWEKLKAIINSKNIKIVSLDLPTSHSLLKQGDEFTNRMQNAMNSMLLDILAAMARKDYDDRRRRQKEGIERRKARNTEYRATPDNSAQEQAIIQLLETGMKSKAIEQIVNCSRTTVWRTKKKYSLENMRI